MSIDPICHCCEGVSAQTPVVLNNRPGLSVVAYRVGDWGQFKSSMLDALSTVPELAGLHTRDDDDFTIALIDAWAVVCDILTFYQERIANESYLRTATERLSIGELARLVGYKLSPGVAASAALAFIMDQPIAVPKLPPGVLTPAMLTNAAPTKIDLPVGSKVQSIPGPGQQPALFETIAGIEARAAWNAILPRTRLPVDPGGGNSNANVRLAGLQNGLQTGDHVLLTSQDGTVALQRVMALEPDTATQTVLVRFEGNREQAPAAPPTAAGVIMPGVAMLNDDVLWTSIKGSRWDDQNDLVAAAAALSWPIDSLGDQINALRGLTAAGAEAPLQAYAMTLRATLFGANSPAYAGLSPSLTQPSALQQVGSGGTTVFVSVSPAYPNNWDTFTLNNDATFLNFPGAIFDLDNIYPALVVGSWVHLRTPNSSVPAVSAPILIAEQTSRADYLLSGKASRVTLDIDWHAIRDFPLRTTQVLGQTARLPVADVMLEAVIDNTAPVMLDGAYLSLKVGQLMSIRGERADKAGQVASEVTAIASLSLVDGYTEVTFSPELSGRYVRNTVTLNANVAPATHGETKSEILGSGDATQAFQRFALKQPPLTLVSAATPSGTRSTLRVRVNGREWTEVPWLYGHSPAEPVYTVITDQAGITWVQFGDGTTTGARLPSGANNIMAVYRQGLGQAGMVEAGKLSLLMSRPLGLKDVSNPLAANGAGDPETLDDGRSNAPVTVRTLDRIVSLEDFEDFARASAGIAKARVIWTSDGVRDLACVTVAGGGGASVVPGSAQYSNLLQAMRAAGDGTVPVVLCDYSPLTFTLAATVKVDPALDGPTVLSAVWAALQSAFGFKARDFMQPVFRSEVISVMQSVPGVVALTLDGLAYSGGPLLGAQPEALTASQPKLGAGGLIGAQLLTLKPGPLSFLGLAS